ncbi:hypothetical protein Tco_0732523 [Tanacetum coccineum]
MAIAITSIFPTLEPEDSLIMGDEELSNILEKESDEFIKSSFKDLVPIPSESEDTSESDSDCDLPSCDDFSPINVYEEKIVNFSSTLLFDLNDDLTSSDTSHYTMRTVTTLAFFFTEFQLLLRKNRFFQTEGFTDEPPLEENDDLFDLKSKMNEWKKILYDDPIDDLIFDPGGDVDEINAFLDIDILTNIKDGFYDFEGEILYLKSLLSNDTILSLPPKVFLDHEPRSLSDINDLKIMVKVFDPEIHDKKNSPTYDCPNYEDSCARGFVHRPLDLQSFA